MNSSIWFFPISALVNAISSFILGLFLIISIRKGKINKILLIFCLSVSFWSFAYFFWQISKDFSSALLWSKILMIPAIFTSILYLHLFLSFLDLSKKKVYKFLLIISYVICFFWVFLDLSDLIFNTGLFVGGVYPVSYFQFWPKAGLFYPFFIFLFIFHFSLASLLLFKNYLRSKGDKRMQLLLLGAGMFLGFIGGSTNYPLWFGIKIEPWGNILVTLYIFLTVYAIIKYKFLDLRVISAELFTSLFFLVLLIDVFLSKNTFEIVSRLFALLFMIFFGLMLVRSVRQEVSRREEVTKLAHSLEKANLRLQELDRQKTDFLSIASHQLRTPLSIAKGYLELLTDGAYGKISPESKEILRQMNESNEHLVKLVDEFLDITRIEQGRTKFVFEDKNIVDLISGVVKELKDRAGAKKLSIVWKTSKEKKVINMDDEKIRHVVFNFIDNAIKYSDKGKIHVSWLSEKNGVSVRVKDNGFGFEKEDEVNFYQKFYRGKNVEGTNVGGTGLGLYVCRKFIENHGGHVWAHSAGLGKGSEFGFWIPGKRGTGNEERGMGK